MAAQLQVEPDYVFGLPNQSIEIPVLQNDTSDGTNPITILNISAPAHGSVSLVTGTNKPALWIDDAFQFAIHQLSNSVIQVASTNLYPRSTQSNGLWNLRNATDWTCGFFPGALWYVYEQKGATNFRTWAQNWTAGISSQQFVTTTFDLGFMINNSFGAGYRLTGNAAYKNVISNAAKSMVLTGYNPAVGCVGIPGASNTFAVINDAAMNMELLFNASRLTTNGSLLTKGSNHIARTIRDHVRTDGSTFHQVIYNATTGAVISQGTRAGASPTSTWARGHAWAIYAFTMGYQETTNLDFLIAGQRTADYYLANVPADYVPYWDFQAPGIPNAPRDSSAAAITAAALVRLSEVATNLQTAASYWQGLNHVLESLASTNYLARGSVSRGILLHGTGEPPQFESPEVDVSLIYGDYYFVEALQKYSDLFRRTAVRYMPAQDFVGLDSFTCLICDSAGQCSTATVTVEIDPGLTNAPLQITLVKNSQAVIRFPTVQGKDYTLLATEDLAIPASSWQSLTNFVGSGQVMEFVEPASSANRYFRLSVQ